MIEISSITINPTSVGINESFTVSAEISTDETVESVSVSFEGVDYTMTLDSGTTYTATLTSTLHGWYRSLIFTATGDGGGEATATGSVFVELSLDAKTNWQSTDRFNISDYNRIKLNLNIICTLSKDVCGQFDVVDMGSDVTSYTAYPYASMFNAFENNLHNANKNCFYINSIGMKKTFYGNGKFIDYTELNRIESAMIKIFDELMEQRQNIPRLAFTLGAYKVSI